MKRFLGAFLVVASLFAGVVQAQETTSVANGPVVPKALGDPHPEGSAFMRINHMKLMRHDRDDTMLLGDREIKYSLKECVACHVVADVDALPVSVEDERHFCRACHDYAAVKVDCFQCHNSKPDPEVQVRLLGAVPDLKDLATYVDEVTE